MSYLNSNILQVDVNGGGTSIEGGSNAAIQINSTGFGEKRILSASQAEIVIEAFGAGFVESNVNLAGINFALKQNRMPGSYMTATVNEKSTTWLEVSFTDRNGDPLNPTSVVYRIDSGDTAIKAETSQPPGATVEIEIPADDNAIIGNALFQTNTVTVTATMGSVQQTEEFTYKIRNLRYIS